MPYDPNNPSGPVDQVRLLITDTSSTPLFTDAEITEFLALEGGNVRLAAAQALDTIASSEVLVSKRIRTSNGLSTDGPAVAKELRERAAELRRQVAEGEGDDTVGLDIVDFIDPFTRSLEDRLL